MNNPNFSVVIPAYNSSQFIGNTINSILNQTLTPLEIIVVDDGSTDDTFNIISDFGDAVSCIRNVRNFGGPSLPRNMAIRRAKGTWIVMFDSDDVMAPTKLEKTACALAANKDVDLFFSDFSVIDVDGNMVQPRFLDSYTSFREALVKANSPCEGSLTSKRLLIALARANFIGTSSVVVKKSCIESVGGFDEKLKNSDDFNMWLDLAGAGYRFGFINDQLHQYRIRNDNISSNPTKRAESYLYVLRSQIEKNSDRLVKQLLQQNLERSFLQFGRSFRVLNRHDEALKLYGAAMSLNVSWQAVKGLLLTLIMKLLHR